ncbi:hypothetical protein Tco_0860297 [Tanacetum coccineum]|uniref:Uncharacterized protein n=1 Tax=Tanacetum coccineum TaxID=301880 RepID=A0ABQ5BEI8_9ASTR
MRNSLAPFQAAVGCYASTDPRNGFVEDTVMVLVAQSAWHCRGVKDNNFRWVYTSRSYNRTYAWSLLVAQVADAARNFEILRDRDDYDRPERSDKRHKSGDQHQSSNQQNSHRGHDQRNDRHGSDRQAVVVTTVTTIATITLLTTTGAVRPSEHGSAVPHRATNSDPIKTRLPTGVILTLSAPHVDVDTQESVVVLQVLVLSAVKLVIFPCGIARRYTVLVRLPVSLLTRSQTHQPRLFADSGPWLQKQQVPSLGAEPNHKISLTAWLPIELKKLTTRELYGRSFPNERIMVSRVAFLGHIVSSEGITMDPAKVEAITKWPDPPASVTLSKGVYLGLAAYYQQILIDGFEELKQRIFSHQFHTLPPFQVDFKFISEVFKERSGVCTMQHGKVNLPYASRPAKAYERELKHETETLVRVTKGDDTNIQYHPGKSMWFDALIGNQEEARRLSGLSLRIVLPRHRIPSYVVMIFPSDRLREIFQLKFSTAFHPETERQSKRNDSDTGDMLRSCALEWTGKLETTTYVLVDFAGVTDALSSTNNEDKVFNPGILIHENLFEVTNFATPEKNVKKTTNASLILEDFNPPLYELPFHKEVLGLGALLSFSPENEEKVYNPGILTSKRVHTSLLSKLSHRGTKAFKVTKILESPMEIFPCFYQEDIRVLDVLCLHFYPP